MQETAIQKKEAIVIDLNNISGEGAFSCPICQTIISPDDESEEKYQIIEAKVKQNELSEIIISCKTCGKIIVVKGFQ